MRRGLDAAVGIDDPLVAKHDVIDVLDLEAAEPVGGVDHPVIEARTHPRFRRTHILAHRLAYPPLLFCDTLSNRILQSSAPEHALVVGNLHDLAVALAVPDLERDGK